MNKEDIPEGNDATAIRQLIASAEKYQNDIDPFIALHTEDVIIVNIAGRRVIGKDSFYRAMKQALESSLSKVYTTTEIKAINFITRDVAIVNCIKNVSDERDGPKDNVSTKLPSAGSLTYLVVRQKREWKIALAQTTPIVQ